MLSHFLAKRIFSNGDGAKQVSRPAVRIATLGMAIGLAVMIISVSVVLGFKHSIRDKVVGFGSHITISSFETSQGIATTPIAMTNMMTKDLEKAPGVEHYQRYTMKQGILKTEDDFLGVLFKGVAEDWDSTFIHNNMVSGAIPKFSSEASTNKILISQMIADKLHLKVGDKIFAYFVGDTEDANSVRMRRLSISGIYQTNLTKFDETLCFADLYTAQHLNGWEDDQVSGIEITVKDFEKLDTTERWMIRNINKHEDKYGTTLSSATIHDSYPQIFSWLNLLDLNVWIILALMVCVASVTMVSGLLIIILERIPMIGILKALGSRNGMIRHTFLWFASFIIIRGMILGNIIGLGICLLQKYTGIITLDPTTYYVAEAPVEISIPFIVLLNVATLILCLFILIAPSFLVTHIHPAQTMKYGD